MSGMAAVGMALAGLSAGVLAQANADEAQRTGSGSTQTSSKSSSQLVSHSATTSDRAREVALDVVVTDRVGKPITDLRAEDFKVFDNGGMATITRFTGASGRAGGVAADAQPVEVQLVIDAINTSHESLARMGDEVRNFLKANGGHLVQPVSILIVSDSDPKAKDGGGPQSSTVTALAQRQAFVRRIPASRDGLVLVKALDGSAMGMSGISEAQGGAGESERTRLSLQALNFIATAERDQPGRKILIWISPGWPLLARSNARTQDELFDTVVYFSDLLRNARMTLDMINPDGVSGGPLASDNPIMSGGSFRGGPISAPPLPAIHTGPNLYENYLKGVKTARQADANDLALQVLAHQTGGLVLLENNQIAPQLARCVGEADAFYTLSLHFPAPKGAVQYHDVEVKAARAGTAARTLTGFYTR